MAVRQCCGAAVWPHAPNAMKRMAVVPIVKSSYASSGFRPLKGLVMRFSYILLRHAFVWHIAS